MAKRLSQKPEAIERRTLSVIQHMIDWPSAWYLLKGIMLADSVGSNDPEYMLVWQAYRKIYKVSMIAAVLDHMNDRHDTKRDDCPVCTGKIELSKKEAV